MTSCFVSAPAFAEARYEGARFDDDQNIRRIAAGTSLNGRLEYRISSPFSAYVNAANLFGANLQTGRSSAGIVTYDAPRLITVGLAYQR